MTNLRSGPNDGGRSLMNVMGTVDSLIVECDAHTDPSPAKQA